VIITKLTGGLGNQMFQYAAGAALAKMSGTALALDIFEFETHIMHQGFELQHVFGHQFIIASKLDIKRQLGWQSPSIIKKILSRKNFSSLRKKNFTVEPYFHYWGGINNLPSDCYISGYWQSEKYFQKFESQIRKDFTFKHPMDVKNTESAKKIGMVNAVSLHVRRGDYINNAKTYATHGLCSIDYYKSAIQYISERTESAFFFIFSDDIEWVKANLVIKHPCQYIDNNEGNESYNDMRLMSLCNHHIIANSSFSWWGAWLNRSPNKIVVTPKNWFANKSNISDLIPVNWVSL